MKLRTILVILLIAALLAVYYFFGTAYLKERRDTVTMVSQIAAAKAQLAQIPPPPTDIAQLQAAASANLTKEKSAFPTLLNSTQLVNAILKLAEASGVKAIPMITQPRAMESVGQINYPVFRLNIAVKGSYTQIADFLSQLESEEPGTLIISGLKLVWVTEQSSSEIKAGDNNLPEADLNIEIYSRPLFTETNAKVDNK
jgi:Tfp pilus assembly protein PilO